MQGWVDATGGDGPGAAGGPAAGEAVVGVCGARGGAGASTFAAALARARHRRGPHPAVLVDLDDAGGGLDVLLGVEDQPGIRWPDLRDARGDVPARELVGLLPRWGDVPVLSGDRTRREPVDDDVRTDVLRALRREAALVLDLPRPAPDVPWWPGDECDAVLVAARKDLLSVAGALGVVARARAAHAHAALVVRGRAPAGLTAAQLAAALDCPVAVEMRSERHLAAAVERGVGPCGARLHRAAARTLDHVAASAQVRVDAVRGPWPERTALGARPVGRTA